MQQAIRTSLLICVVTVVVNAADRNWNIGNDVQWNNIATWHEGAIPTAADDVYLNVGSTISVSGSDASANSVALHNSAGTCSLKVQNGAGLPTRAAALRKCGLRIQIPLPPLRAWQPHPCRPGS